MQVYFFYLERMGAWCLSVLVTVTIAPETKTEMRKCHLYKEKWKTTGCNYTQCLAGNI